MPVSLNGSYITGDGVVNRSFKDYNSEEEFWQEERPKQNGEKSLEENVQLVLCWGQVGGEAKKVLSKGPIRALEL